MSPVVPAFDPGQRSTSHRVATLIVLAIFLICCIRTYAWKVANSSGDDLSASYIAARLLATGQKGHLYSHDPVTFSDVKDSVWDEAADEGGFDESLHPYVQTPLWAFLLQPLAMHLQFRAFDVLFTVWNACCFAALLWLVAWAWAPLFLHPFWMATVAAGLFLSEPFRYGMFLTQTHILFVLLTVAALILAERGHPVPAGIALALAAAVKLSPGVLVVYWLLTRRWRAAATMGIASVVLFLLTILATGWPTTAAYLQEVHRISRTLLVAFNNQSFVAWIMGLQYAAAEISTWHVLPLPDPIRWISSLLLLGSLVAGSWMDRGLSSRAPLGGVVALVAATIFAPISWTHYSIVLLVPIMILIDQNRRLCSKWLAALVIATVALNFQPLAMDAQQGTADPLSLVRAQFYAGLLCLLSLFAAYFLATRGDRFEGSSELRKRVGSAPGSSRSIA